MVLGIAIIGRRSQIVKKKKRSKHETSTPPNLPQVQQSLTWILHLHLQPCCCLTCTPGAAKRISEMSRWGLKTWFAEIYVPTNAAPTMGASKRWHQKMKVMIFPLFHNKYVTKMNLWILFLPKSPQKKCSYALNPLKVFHSRVEN